MVIPDSVWSLDDEDTIRLRYDVVGLSLVEDSPLYVVRVVDGTLAGHCYLVGPSIIKSLMTATAKRRAGGRLRRLPTAV